MNNESVAVLYRMSSIFPATSTNPPLILGVFESPRIACAYVEKSGLSDGARWSVPRPGRWHWELTTSAFCYVVEICPIRTSASVPLEYEGDDFGVVHA